MANAHWIVVEDVTGDWWTGAVVDAVRAKQLEARGVALLPVVPDLFRTSGVGGFHYRPWGSGISLATSVPRMAAPLTLYGVQELTMLHWKARLVPDAELLKRVEAGETGVFDGQLKIASDSSQALVDKMGLVDSAPVEARTLDKRHLSNGGFVVGGQAPARVPGPAHYGVALYGAMRGMRVAWAAASLARE